MALQSGCTAVTITDVDAGRVAYALKHGFATHGHVVPVSPYSRTSSGTSTPSSGMMTPLSTYSTVPDKLDLAKSIASDLLSITHPDLGCPEEDEDTGVDVTFECTGKEACMQTALYATRPGGKVVMVGMGTPIQTVPLSAAHLREVDILGVFRYANTYKTGIRMLARMGMAGGLPSLDGMVTHRFKGLERAAEAFEVAGRTKDGEGGLVLKVVIEA